MIWLHTLDVREAFELDDDVKSAKAIAAAVALFASAKVWSEDEELQQISEEMTDAANEYPFNIDWFNAAWNGFYNWADDNRVWVNT